ncbi:MAG: cysteine hydrolase [Hyphomicrobiales bacterium]|nr:cysteine hydrolase [Hyphomicrobiales bacterium]
MGELRHPLTARSVHLCVDMQRIFSNEGPWATPWMERVLPRIERLAERFPERTVFTRFITPENPADMHGMWRLYYERWPQTTQRVLDPKMLHLMPTLARLAPPAQVVDKSVYSGFAQGALPALLRARGADALIVTGAETDVCVLATVMGAIDHGYRVVLATDAVCSSSDACHDALLTVYRNRFAVQIETADVETVLSAWPT